MQQNERMKNPLYVCTLSKEEIDDPLLVFDRLFRQYSLPDLRQINVGLLRSVIQGEGFSALTPDEQNSFIRFSSEMARTMEAAHILHLDRKDGAEATQTIASEPETPYGMPKNDAAPLTVGEKKDPAKVLKMFAEDFPLLYVQSLFYKMIKAYDPSSRVIAEANALGDLLYVFRHISKFLDAVFLIANYDALNEANVVVIDLDASDHQFYNA